jgi:hypothetical protein
MSPSLRSDLRARLDVVAKRKNPFPCRELNPGRPARSLITILTELQGEEQDNVERNSNHHTASRALLSAAVGQLRIWTPSPLPSSRYRLAQRTPWPPHIKICCCSLLRICFSALWGVLTSVPDRGCHCVQISSGAHSPSSALLWVSKWQFISM